MITIEQRYRVVCALLLEDEDVIEHPKVVALIDKWHGKEDVCTYEGLTARIDEIIVALESDYLLDRDQDLCGEHCDGKHD